MSTVNRVILLGHLARDPEVRTMPNGTMVANFTMATNESYKDRNGVKQEKTEWHKIVLYGRSAEIAEQYLRKGSLTYVEGKLQTRKWTDRDGQDHYTTEIIGDRMQMIGGKNGGNGSASEDRPASASRSARNTSRAAHQEDMGDMPQESGVYDPFNDDDIPF